MVDRIRRVGVLEGMGRKVQSLRFSTILLALLVVSGFSQTVNLTGTVTNAANNAPISKATVKLLGDTMSATTDAAGMYLLKGTAVAILPTESQSFIRLTPGKLKIDLKTSENLKVEIFNLWGKKIASPVNGNLAKGIHVFSTKAVLDQSASIMRITRGNQVHTYKLGGTASFVLDNPSGSLAKTAATYTLEVSAVGFVTKQQPITALTGTNNIQLTAQTSDAELYYDNTDSAISFAARNLQKTLGIKGTQATLKTLAEFGTPTGAYIVIAKKDAAVLSKFTGQAIGTLGEQDYVHRVTGTSAKGYWVIGGDRRGAMYGGIHLGEIVAGGSLADVKDLNEKPYIVNRGIKFNIPLDVRTPSFDDGGDASKMARKDVWDLAFWREYFDVMAIQRYNTISLWNRHPFPSLVNVDKYKDVTLAGVQGDNGMINNWDITQKIAFWNQVMEMAYNRGVNIVFMVWNVELQAADGKDGISTDKFDPEAIDYLRKATEQLFLSYPRLWGFGLCAGEKMSNYTDIEKEQYVWQAYGMGIMDVKAKFPNRYIQFIHRNWLTDAAEMEKAFSKLPDQYDYSVKYCQARLYAVTKPMYALNIIRRDGGVPTTRKAWWELRQDDVFHQRWGDPDYVKEMVLNFPHESKPCTEAPCLTAGYFFGSDRFLWARESMSKNPQTPLRQLETLKHWYSFTLWGRLGYDPNTSHELLIGLIKYKYPSIDAAALFDVWQGASKIIPMVERFHFLPWDYYYNVEIQRGNSFGGIWNGYHSIDKIISSSVTHESSGYLNIKDFVAGGKTGTSPLVVADSLENYANSALTKLAGLSDNGNAELKETLGDIRSQSNFGLFWANKIRGGVSLAKFQKNKVAQDKTDAIASLTKAWEQWKLYAAQLNASYNKTTLSGSGMFDPDAMTLEVEKDINMAKSAN